MHRRVILRHERGHKARVIAVWDAACRAKPGDEDVDTLSDEAARLRQRDRGAAFVRQDGVGDAVQVRRAVDQRPVKIEDDPRPHRAILGVGPGIGHSAPAAASRMARMLAP